MISGMVHNIKNSGKNRVLNVSKRGAKTGITCSKNHGGFDNDVATMNSIMTTILGKPPKEPFTEKEMK